MLGRVLLASDAAFQDASPDLYAAYVQLDLAVHANGPLDSNTRALVKLAVCVGVEGAVHSHTRKCLAAGHGTDAIRQVLRLAIPTVGFPAGIAALSWVNDIRLAEFEQR